MKLIEWLATAGIGVLVLVVGVAVWVNRSGSPGGESDEAATPDSPWSKVREPIKCEGHETFVNNVAVSPDGKLVASGSDDQTLRLWNAADGKQVRKLQAIDPPQRGEGIGGVQFSPDGKLLAAAVTSVTGKRVRFWDVESGKEVQRRHTIEIEGRGSGLAFSPDGTKLAVAGHGVLIWDLKGDQKLHDFRFNRQQIGCAHWVTFSPDSKLLAAALSDFGGDSSSSPKVRIWDVASGKEVFTAWEIRGHANAVAFSPDGKLLAAGKGSGGLIEVWDVKTKERVHSIRADEHVVFCLAFSPDGKTLASGGNEPAIKLWDVASGKASGQLKGHSGQVAGLAFSADGKALVSADRDKLVLIWRTAADPEGGK